MGELIGLKARLMAASFGEESKYSPYNEMLLCGWILAPAGHIYDWM